MRNRLIAFGAVLAAGATAYLATGEDPAATVDAARLIAYCPADGTGPQAPVDWSARQREVSAIPADSVAEDGTADTHTRDAAQAALDDERRAVTSHLVRNGNGPRTAALSPAEVAAAVRSGALGVVLDGEADKFGGRLASLSDGKHSEPLLCPEDREPLRAVTIDPDGGTP